ncbi:MAG: hypothetical protein HY540_01385 [Deltaproteobacteria bacterium]|nr:hypothetical protein [Deltaproteobacteria bacterium]
MMKLLFIAIALLLPLGVLANPPCPDSAGSLQAFRCCLTPVAGGAALGKSTNTLPMDEDHQRMIAIMANTSTVPPQVIPTGPIYTTTPFPSYPGYIGGPYLATSLWWYFPARFR